MTTPDSLPKPVETAVLHDARAVHDTASFRFTDFTTVGTPSWVLASVTPGPNSGSGTIPGAFIKAETGEFVVPPDAGAVLVKEGSWKVVAAARQPKSQAMSTYSWTEPLRQKRILDPEDYYSPFIHGGTIVCRPTPEKLGLAQFGPVHLIFPEWGQFVAATAEFAEQHGGHFEQGGTRPGDADLLMSVLFHENKLISALAFQGLIASKSATPEVIRKGLLQDDGPARTILCYLVITGPEPAGADALLNVVVDALQAVPDQGRIHSIALGAFAAGLFLAGDRRILSRSKSVLSRASGRCNKLGVDLNAAPALRLMFQRLGVRP